MFTALGAALGLGNALRFPGLCATHGGGAFIFVYALSLAVVFPVLYAELSLGQRRSGAFPLTLEKLKKRGSFVGLAACANSAFVGIYYAGIIVYLIYSACAILPETLSGAPALDTRLFSEILHCDGNMPQSISVSAVILLAAVWLLVYAVLKRGAIASSAKISLLAQVFAFAVLAVRGLFYENSSVALTALFLPDFSCLADGSLWSDALGQALLSLSLAAGVMPAFAKKMPRGSSPAVCAFKIIAANFAGCILSSVGLFCALYGCGLFSLVTDNGIVTAFCVYPRAIAALFPSAALSGAFGIIFYSALSLTAFQSAVSLLSAIVSAVAGNKDGAVKILCGAGFVLSSVFATNSASVMLGVCDFTANSVNALLIAAAESLIFASRAKSFSSRPTVRLCLKTATPAAICVLAAYGLFFALVKRRDTPAFATAAGIIACLSVLCFGFLLSLIKAAARKKIRAAAKKS